MGIYWFNVDEFENMVAEKQLIPGGYRSDTSLTMTSGQMTVSAVSREKAMAPHSSTLAWEIPWMEKPGRLQSMGSQRVGHD